MSGVIRGQADRRRDRLESHSPMERSRSSSPQSPYRNESLNPAAGASHHVVEAILTAADCPWPSVAVQVTIPSRSPSPGTSVPEPNMSPTPPSVLSRPVNQLAINSNNLNSNVNYNAPGGVIVNHNSNVTQVVTHDQADEDLNTIKEGLGQHHVARALYDSQPLAGGCMEGTRVQVLEDTEGLLTSRGGPHIVWIAGMAGTGKTSIALTLSRRLVKLPILILGGTFFCSRSAGAIERTDAQRIIPTLATVLARRLPAYARALAAELRDDPDLASKEVNVQVKRLLLKPLKSVRTRDKQLVLVIDALDECRDQVLLAELINALADFDTTPLNNPESREWLVKLIEGLEAFKRKQLDSLARLAGLIGSLVDFKATLPGDCTTNPRLERLIDSLADFRQTKPKGYDQTELSELISGLAVFKTAPLNHSGNLEKLIKLVDSLAYYKASRLDGPAKLAGLIDALAGIRTTSLDDCANQMRIEWLIDALVGFKTTPLNNVDNQAQLTQLIDALADFRSTPSLKFLLTSRPEMHIRDTPITDKSLSSIVQLHMVDKNVVTSDIRLYIQRTLERSCKSLRWYTDRDIDDLAALSAGLFIFASTVLAYILRRKDGPGRSERIRIVKLQAAESAIATDPLDRMYSLVLMQASDPTAYEPAELDETRRIVAIILSTRSPFTIKELAVLLGVSTEHIRGALNELHAVVFVPERDDEGELRTLHASFGDYVFTRATVHIRIEKSLGHEELARACLERMAADDLCFNISRSQSSYEPNPKTKPDWIARSLLYACLNWTYHIDLASEGFSFEDGIAFLLRVKLLFWLEVLSVMGHVEHASEYLRLAVKKVASPDVSQLLRDADSFVTLSCKAIERSAPHIYISAMAVAPKSCLIRQNFASHLIGIPETEIFGVDSISCTHDARVHSVSGAKLPIRPVDGHTLAVYAIALSSDGRLIASASADGSARVWNAQTYQQMYPPLLGHTAAVRAVAFSLDGRWIATGSDDQTSRMWNAQTGQYAMIELRGQTGSVRAIAFSPNSLHLASGSRDKTVWVWDVSTRQPTEISRMQSVKSVSSVTYSPDGAFIAVGSEQSWIQIFDVATGREFRKLKSSNFYTDISLVFSPDGTQLVAAAWNRVDVLDALTGQRVTNLPGLNAVSGVNAVAYSPDSQIIACGTIHRRVLLWRPDGNTVLQLLSSGHASAISSVTFSSDGRFLITGSEDTTIRILDLDKMRSLADGSDQSPLTPIVLAHYETESVFDSTGWLVSASGQLLLWVPPAYRGRLVIGDYSRIIATSRVVVTAKDGVLYQGENWIKCWRAPS